MRCACLSSYMHMYPYRSGYKLYAVIILATGSCVLKYDPPLSTVDSSVTQKTLCTHTFSLRACVLFTHVYIRIVCSTYIVYIYMCVFHIWSCFKRWVFLDRKYAHELTRPTRTCCSRISASGAVLRSKLSRSRSRRKKVGVKVEVNVELKLKK